MRKYLGTVICGLLAILTVVWGLWVSRLPSPPEAKFALEVPERAELFNDFEISEPAPAVQTTMHIVREKIAVGADVIVTLYHPLLSLDRQTATLSYWVKDGDKWLKATKSFRVNWPFYVDPRWHFDANQTLVVSPVRTNNLVRVVMILVLTVGLAYIIFPRKVKRKVKEAGL